MEAELHDRWATVVGVGGGADAALDGLLARYREPHRRYHGLVHVIRVLRSVDELLAHVGVDDPDGVRLAAWFHDAVYRPAAGDEEASAVLAESVLGELGVAPGRVADVGRLVRVTASHEPVGPDEQVLVDADLAILAADPATYTAYARGVRAEYAHVDDQAWRIGRAAVLRRFLERPRLFQTRPMTTAEGRARANLAAELAALEAHAGAARPGGTVPSVDAPETVAEAVALLVSLGYTGEVTITSGTARCKACATAHPFDRLVADHVYRFEGMSDPSDEAIVIGVTCPACATRSILVSAYGPEADPEELAGVRMVAEHYAG